MADTIEKIYCSDRGDDNALAAAILANKCNNSNDLLPALMNNNNWMNNPFAYIMFLALFRNGAFGGDNGNLQGAETQAQLNSIRTQLQDNQNADAILGAIKGNSFDLSQLAQNLNVDFNTLQKSCCDIQAAIQQVAGSVGFSAERVINAVNMGDCGVISAIKDCCCSQKELIQRMGYENQLGLKDSMFATQKGFCDLSFATQAGFDRTNTGLERGFAASSYETQRQTCDIINAGNTNTQRIIDTLTNHWNDENQRKIQDLKFELSQERQNRLLLSRLGDKSECCNWSSGF